MSWGNPSCSIHWKIQPGEYGWPCPGGLASCRVISYAWRSRGRDPLTRWSHCLKQVMGRCGLELTAEVCGGYREIKTVISPPRMGFQATRFALFTRTATAYCGSRHSTEA